MAQTSPPLFLIERARSGAPHEIAEELGEALGIGGVSGLNLYSLAIAVIGAIVVLLVYRAVSARA